MRSTRETMQSMETEASSSGSRRFLRFRSADGDRLVRLEDVVECSPMVQIEADMRADAPRYRGLLHFRGRVVPVFEPTSDQPEPIDPDWFLVVLQSDDGEIALVARDFYDIYTTDADNYAEVDIGAGRAITVVSSEEEVVRVVRPEQFVVR